MKELRKVEFKNYIAKEFITRQGFFHSWGVDSPCEGSTNSIAIIELPDGIITTANPEYVKFLEPIIEQPISKPVTAEQVRESYIKYGYENKEYANESFINYLIRELGLE